MVSQPAERFGWHETVARLKATDPSRWLGVSLGWHSTSSELFSRLSLCLLCCMNEMRSRCVTASPVMQLGWHGNAGGSVRHNQSGRSGGFDVVGRPSVCWRAS